MFTSEILWKSIKKQLLKWNWIMLKYFIDQNKCFFKLLKREAPYPMTLILTEYAD